MGGAASPAAHPASAWAQHTTARTRDDGTAAPRRLVRAGFTARELSVRDTTLRDTQHLHIAQPDATWLPVRPFLRPRGDDFAALRLHPGDDLGCAKRALYRLGKPHRCPGLLGFRLCAPRFGGLKPAVARPSERRRVARNDIGCNGNAW